VTWLNGKSEEEWAEIWRQERLREDEMLAFYDEAPWRLTKKELAKKFNLRPTRVSLLTRRRDERRHRERMAAALEMMSFTATAERLWMDLGWLATELEKRANRPTGGMTGPMKSG